MFQIFLKLHINLLYITCGANHSRLTAVKARINFYTLTKGSMGSSCKTFHTQSISIHIINYYTIICIYYILFIVLVLIFLFHVILYSFLSPHIDFIEFVELWRQLWSCMLLLVAFSAAVLVVLVDVVVSCWCTVDLFIISMRTVSLCQPPTAFCLLLSAFLPD